MRSPVRLQLVAKARLPLGSGSLRSRSLNVHASRGSRGGLGGGSGSAFATARSGSFATAVSRSGFATASRSGFAARSRGRFTAARSRFAASGLAALLGAETGKQTTAMLLVLAAADGLAADRGSRFAASRLAALAAEQAGVGLLILTDHGETNHGDQDGNRRQNDTIHLKLLPRECGKKQLSRNIDRRNCSLPCAASTVGCGWVNA